MRDKQCGPMPASEIILYHCFGIVDEPSRLVGARRDALSTLGGEGDDDR